MRTTILLFLISLPSWGAFSYYRTLTVTSNSALLPSTQANFPVLVSLSDVTLKDAAHGGHVQSASAFDVNFFTDFRRGTALSWEVEFYDGAAGVLQAWVNVPSCALSTVFYMFYGDPGLTSSQSTAANAWNTNFKFAAHLNGSGPSFADSTASPATGTNHGATAGTGKIAGGMALVAASSQYVDYASPAKLQITNDLTLSCWFLSTTTSPQSLINNQARVATNRGIFLLLNSTTANQVSIIIANGSAFDSKNFSASLNDSAWHHLAATFASGVIEIFVDGASIGTQTSATVTALSYGTEAMRLAANAAPSTYFGGSIDEVRISNVVLTANWITATYATQSAPTTFLAIGAETRAIRHRVSDQL